MATMEIPLTRGYVATIDEDDFHLVDGGKWQAHIRGDRVYAARKFMVDGIPTNFYMHRRIMGVRDRKIDIDHIDGNGLMNTRINLRAVSRTINSRNKLRGGKAGTSKYVGVYWSVNNRNWVAQIKTHRKMRYLGSFQTEEEANAARIAAEVEIWGMEPRRLAAIGADDAAW